MESSIETIQKFHENLLKDVQNKKKKEGVIFNDQSRNQLIEKAHSLILDIQNTGRVTDLTIRDMLDSMLSYWETFIFSQTGNYPSIRQPDSLNSESGTEPDYSKLKVETAITISKQASYEIVKFLEGMQDIPPNLPDAVTGYWQEIIETYHSTKLDWNKARTLGEQIMSALGKLRNDDVDFRQVDKALGQVSILLGAIHLGQQKWQSAAHFFEQGSKYLRYWGEKDFESLAHFGLALTYKNEEIWPSAAEALQKALDALRDFISKGAKHTRHLEERIEQEIDFITRERPQKEKLISSFSPLEEPVRLPIVGDIAGGLGVIAQENIVEYLSLDYEHRNGADFGVRVIGDSMIGDSILPGDIVLIRQQPTVQQGEIAAVIIMTPQIDALGVLKRYFVVGEYRKDLAHWLLESSNPLSEHLIVTPSGANEEAILNIYSKKVQVGKIRKPPICYSNAELVIAGKFVGLIRKNVGKK